MVEEKEEAIFRVLGRLFLEFIPLAAGGVHRGIMPRTSKEMPLLHTTNSKTGYGLPSLREGCSKTCEGIYLKPEMELTR